MPIPVLHFTRIEHLSSIVTDGLLADSGAHEIGRLSVEVGNANIKARRSSRPVPVDPGGVVADYVPFYFAPRSPMMFAIHSGNVPTYQEGCGRLIYLASTVERLSALELPIVLTDRNAVLDYADFVSYAHDTTVLEEDFIDWNVMRARYWSNTPEEPERRERRMAECLVHRRVPWEAFTGVIAASDDVAEEAASTLNRLEVSTPTSVRGGWYF